MTCRSSRRKARMDKGREKARRPRRQQRIDDAKRGDVIEIAEPEPIVGRLPN